MLKNRIEELRYQLNKFIQLEYSCEEIYKLSIEMDQLIVQFYKNKNR